jgi:hypothetical protein
VCCLSRVTSATASLLRTQLDAIGVARLAKAACGSSKGPLQAHRGELAHIAVVMDAIGCALGVAGERSGSRGMLFRGGCSLGCESA